MNSLVHCFLGLLFFVGPMTGLQRSNKQQTKSQSTFLAVPADYSYDYDCDYDGCPNYDEGDYGEVSTGPVFVTNGQTFLFNKGDTIR